MDIWRCRSDAQSGVAGFVVNQVATIIVIARLAYPDLIRERQVVILYRLVFLLPAVKLQPVMHDVVAVFIGNLLLHPLDFR